MASGPIPSVRHGLRHCSSTIQHMVDCKYCRMPLYTTWTGKCRTCGKQAGFFRQMGVTPTLTQRGAIKDMHRKMKKAERAIGDSYGFEYVASPPNVLHGMTWQAAEELACKWMRRHGYADAKLTSGGADGGIDVMSRRAVAQVKHHAKPVGISEMQHSPYRRIDSEEGSVLLRLRIHAQGAGMGQETQN